MADQYTGWYCRHETSVVEDTNTTKKIKVSVYWQNDGWSYHTYNNVDAWVYCNGTEKKVATDADVNLSSPSTNWNSQLLGSAEFTINKTTTTQNISCSAKIQNKAGYGTGTKSSTATTVSVAAKPSYKITYNANGGSGAPSAQTKWYGTNITLSSTKPTRAGYTFVRWNTNTSNTGTAYSPGATYSGNAALTLYAIWQAITYTVTYNKNTTDTVSSLPSNQTKTHGQNLTLSSNTPTRTNYNFLGWSTSTTGGVVYEKGAIYTNNASITLYAVWQLAYKKPRLTGFSARRCGSDGTANESGTYAKVTFSWETDKTVTAVRIQYKTQTATDWTIATVTASGTSGSVSQVVGGGNLAAETSYVIRAYVSDGSGDSYTTYSTILSLGTVKFPIDIKSGGTGVAFGKVAERSDELDSGWSLNLPNDKYLKFGTVPVMKHSAAKNLIISTDEGSIYFRPNGNGVSTNELWINKDGKLNGNDAIFNGVLGQYGGVITNFNSVLSEGEYMVNASTTNYPSHADDYGKLIVKVNNGTTHNNSSNWIWQYFINTKGIIYGRYKIAANAWQPWMIVSKYKNLYDNSSGTTGTVTLSETAENFSYLEVFWVNSNTTTRQLQPFKVTNPNGKDFVLNSIQYGNDTRMTATTKTYTISGTSMTVKYACQANNMDNSATNKVSAYEAVKIIKVIGYR